MISFLVVLIFGLAVYGFILNSSKARALAEFNIFTLTTTLSWIVFGIYDNSSCHHSFNLLVVYSKYDKQHNTEGFFF